MKKDLLEENALNAEDTLKSSLELGLVAPHVAVHTVCSVEVRMHLTPRIRLNMQKALQ